MDGARNNIVGLMVCCIFSDRRVSQGERAGGKTRT